MPNNDECVNTKLNQFSFFIAALKVKLLVRRSANQLVEQNILPRNEPKCYSLLTRQFFMLTLYIFFCLCYSPQNITCNPRTEEVT